MGYSVHTITTHVRLHKHNNNDLHTVSDSNYSVHSYITYNYIYIYKYKKINKIEK